MTVPGLCCYKSFSLVIGSEGYSLVSVCMFLNAVASLVLEPGFWGSWAQWLRFLDSKVQAQWLWPTGLVAPPHVGSSWTRDGTHVSCIGRQVLHHQGSPALFFFCLFVCFLVLFTSSLKNSTYRL